MPRLKCSAILLGVTLLAAGARLAKSAPQSQPTDVAPATQPAPPDLAALEEQVTASGNNLAAAQKQCDDRLAADPAFAALQSNEADALKTLQAARESGTPDDRLAASSAYVKAASAVKSARESARKSDPAVVAAKQQFDADLHALNAAKAQQVQAPPPAPPSVAGLPGMETYEARARKIIAAGVGGHGTPYAKRDADKAIADAAAVDAKIQKLLDSGKATKDVAKNMWAGTPMYAMNRDDLEAFGTLTLIQQGVDTQEFNFVPFSPAGNLTGDKPKGVHVNIGMMGGIFVGDFPR